MSGKRRKRHGPEQIVRKLRDADAMLNAGKDVATVLQALDLLWLAHALAHCETLLGSLLLELSLRIPIPMQGSIERFSEGCFAQFLAR